MSTAELTLTASLGSYDLNRPFWDGRVRPEGVDWVLLDYRSPVRHWRMVRLREFDVCELSMGAYFALRDSGDDSLVALPVFPRRRFRHSYLYVRSAAGVDGASDLEGRTVGIRTWQVTSGVWARGILADQFGVDLWHIRWVAQAPPHIPVVPERLDLRLAPSGQHLEDLLLDGALDALISPDVPSDIRSGVPEPRVRRLFPEYRQLEVAYFRETGIFPIMHVVVVKRELLERHPWLASSLCRAFIRARTEAMRSLLDPERSSLAWAPDAVDAHRETLGEDAWPAGVEANRPTLEAFARHCQDQGLVRRAPEIDELFADSDLLSLRA